MGWGRLKQVLTAGATACALSGPLLAQTPDRSAPGTDIDIFVSPVVTPSREETPFIQSPTTVQVITRQDLQSAGTRTVGEALARFSGNIQAVEGSVGTYYSIRGYSSSSAFNERELILLDGQPLNDSVLGTFDLSAIPTNNIDHIEIVAGPGSALYGPNAFAGVINIITRRPSDIPNDMGEMYGGSGVFAAGGVAAGSLSRSKAPERQNAWSISGLYNRDPGETGVANSNNQSGAIRAAATISPGLDAAVGHYLADNGSVGYAFTSPPTPHDRLRFSLTTGLLTWHPVGTAHPTTLRAYAELGSEQSRSERPVGSGAFSMLGVNTGTYGVEGQTSFSQGIGGNLLAGFDIRQNTSGGGIAKTASNIAMFGQEEIHRGRFAPSIGLRYDYHSVYGGRLNPRLAATYQLSPRFYLRGSLGTAYRAPNFLELYIKGYVLNRAIPVPPFVIPVTLTGNPALKPEETVASELGIRGQLTPDTTLDGAIFLDQLRNLITFLVPPPAPGALPTGTWANAGSAPVFGTEVTLSHLLGRNGRTSLQYVYLDAHSVHLNNPAAVAPLTANPHHQLVWQTYASHLDGFDAGLVVDARSGSPARGGAVITDLTVGHGLAHGVNLQLIAHNLFDNIYQVGDTIPGRGRTVYARLSGSF